MTCTLGRSAVADAIDHKARGHARFGASSAARWFACPGSVRLCDMVGKRAAGAAADEGTRAHELLEACLSDKISERACQDLFDFAPQDMINAVFIARDYVHEILAQYPDAVMLVEHPFEIPVAAAPGEVWGTCDVVIFVPSLRLLYVIDYKHGAGTFVDVRGNKQLRFYGLGALASRPEDWTGKKCKVCKGHGENNEGRCSACGGTGDEYGHLWEIDTVALVIIQPRCPFGDPVREEWLQVEDLLEFGKEIGAAVEAAKQSDAPLVPGPWCKTTFCPRSLSCPAREAQAVATTGVAFADVKSVVLPVAGDITDAKIAEVLKAKDSVIDWLNAVEVEGARRMMAGGTISGRKLVEAQARRQWEQDNVASAEKLALIANQPPQEFLVQKLRGLTEVETILKKGVDRTEARRRLDAMAFLTTKKSSGKLTVVPESDPRPAVNRVASAFDGVAQIEAEVK